MLTITRVWATYTFSALFLLLEYVDRHAEDDDGDQIEVDGNGGDQLVDGTADQLDTDEQNEKGNDHRGHVFHAGMAEGVVAVCGLGRELEAEQRDHRGACIR